MNGISVNELRALHTCKDLLNDTATIHTIHMPSTIPVVTGMVDGVTYRLHRATELLELEKN